MDDEVTPDESGDHDVVNTLFGELGDHELLYEESVDDEIYMGDEESGDGVGKLMWTIVGCC